APRCRRPGRPRVRRPPRPPPRPPPAPRRRRSLRASLTAALLARRELGPALLVDLGDLVLLDPGFPQGIAGELAGRRVGIGEGGGAVLGSAGGVLPHPLEARRGWPLWFPPIRQLLPALLRRLSPFLFVVAEFHPAIRTVFNDVDTFVAHALIELIFALR